MSNIKKIKDRIKKFEAMPAICQQVLAHMNDKNVNFKTLADKIKYDPGMTVNILKLANSAYFGLARRVNSLQSAIVLLGMKRLFQVVVAQKSASHMESALKGYDLSPKELLKHSVWTAVGAEAFSKELELKAPDLLFTAGLLHDIGKVIMDPFVEKNRQELLETAGRDGLTFDAAERKILEINHADVGAELFKIWHFPLELETVVRLHHTPSAVNDQNRILATVVHLADMLAYSSGVGTGIDGLKYRVCEESTQSFGLKGRVLERVASRTLETMTEMEQLLSEMI